MDKVHDLLFPQLKVGDLVLQWLKQALQVHILPDKHVEIFDQLIILLLELIALHLHFFIVRSRHDLSQRLVRCNDLLLRVVACHARFIDVGDLMLK